MRNKFLISQFNLVRLVLSSLLIIACVLNTAYARVTEIKSEELKNKLQIWVSLDQKVDYRAFSLSDPNRVVIDIASPMSENFSNKLSFKNRGAERVRTGHRGVLETRVVIDLFADYYWKVSSLPADASNPFRILIEVYDRDLVAAEEARKQSEHPQTVLIPKNPTPPKRELELTAVGSKEQTTTNRQTASRGGGSSSFEKVDIETGRVIPESAKTITKPVSTQTKTVTPMPAPRDMIVMIDPGHGGKDPGAVGPNKTREKDLVLQISKRLKDEIDGIYGMRAILTRDSDRYLSLRERLKVARDRNADLFLSIHADAFTSADVKGSSVFILSTGGASSEAARWLAQSENAADLKYGVNINDYDEDLSRVLMDIQQNVTIEHSNEIAKYILSELGKVGEVHKSYVERAGFAVLKSPDIPSVLIETAFISNPAEEKKLKTASYQKKLAKRIARGIQRYYDENLPQHLLLLEPN